MDNFKLKESGRTISEDSTHHPDEQQDPLITRSTCSAMGEEPAKFALQIWIEGLIELNIWEVFRKV